MTVGINRKELLKWLNACIYNGNHEEGIRFFAVRHIDADERATPVREWPYKNGFDVDAHASEMIHTMEMDAGGLRASQRYVIEAYFGTSKSRGRRFTATIDPPNDIDGDSSGISEGAGTKGEHMQLRRHNENMHKLSVGSSLEMMRILRTENDMLRDQVKMLFEERMKTITLTEELISKKHIRDEDSRDRDENRKMKAMVIKQVAPLAGVFANRMLGSNLLPEVRPVDMMIQNIAKVIIENPDKMHAVYTTFSDHPEILAQLQELIREFKVVDEAAQ